MKIILFLSFSFFSISLFAANSKLSLHPLQVSVSAEMKLAKENFNAELSPIVSQINASFQKRVAIAPMGGSKITPFKELNLDGLVIIDWLKTGMPSEVAQDFSEENKRKNLKAVVRRGLMNGAMSSSEVKAVTMTAQILARLNLELHARNIRVHYRLLKKDSEEMSKQGIHVDQNLWRKGISQKEDPVLVTHFSFESMGKEKDLVVLSHVFTSDQDTERDSVPQKHLKSLVQGNYSWLYLSADGVGFFSAKEDNGLQGASRKFLSLLDPGAGVILDYPSAAYTHTCNQIFGGMTFMCGRNDLENYGLQKSGVVRINDPVFGYSGVSSSEPDDQVRIYRVPQAENHRRADLSPSFDFSQFVEVGQSLNVSFQ